ncbi:protein-L-isoaspartate O-methyltransferase family protein [Cellulomonas sp. NS3]|uniref:protein-L-isoaspartate O-methyltransferase family protein n=1 Tax=Cellulomonas sp. NS3 TaxID=2973977 RepID=UPI0021611016|nr:protein-L-isoaspartate O-methyltransferase [Cellulomonas sp. NS3]
MTGVGGRRPDPLERADDVAQAMRDLDRRAFLPPDQRPHAHEDRPLPLGHGLTCSQPSTVATMLRWLRVPVGARVLDVGSGSGWTTALLARLVGPQGEVLGLELEPGLAQWGAENLAATRQPWARIEPATPGTPGREVSGGWSRILVSAAAQRLPHALLRQVADGGRVVLPVRTTLWVVERRGETFVHRRLGSYAFVPLR